VLHETSRIVTVDTLMTVPGKGGRPRKWRSDTDRQRAWRARQAGIAEPPTLVQAFDDGDELARVWAMVRDLGEQLDTANTTVAELRRERDQARRELDRERQRWGWIESRNIELVAERDRLAVEIDDLHDQIRHLEAVSRPPQAATGEPPPIRPIRADVAGQPPLSRAQRRRLEREQRRRHEGT
jgi:hypothetical protein